MNNTSRKRLKSMREGDGEFRAALIRNGRNIFFRKRSDGEISGDEAILREVLERKSYAISSIDFDVKPGEVWLDLGANIGAFAIYCLERNASVVCYEPDSDCFALLNENVPEAELHQMAVTAEQEENIAFFSSPSITNHSRGTIFAVRGYKQDQTVPNCWIGKLVNRKFDGIKMDIEGAECGILDAKLLPACQKLVLEYHTSRDGSMESLARRLAFLRERFAIVKYPSEFDKAISSGVVQYKSWFDRLFFCKDAKHE